MANIQIIQGDCIKKRYFVQGITKNDYAPWLLKKHYAHRIPCISYSYGLYETRTKDLFGVCTFGPPARMLNDGYGCFSDGFSVQTFELNRLVISDIAEKNTLSFFVSKCLNFLPKPCCVVSYADGNSGHHGYIYQATNWLFTGITSTETVYIDERTGKSIHPRSVVSEYGSRELSSLPNYIKISKESIGKYRYFKFLGTKKDIKTMKKEFLYEIMPYPKGNNERYDASYEPKTQSLLF